MASRSNKRGISARSNDHEGPSNKKSKEENGVSLSTVSKLDQSRSRKNNVTTEEEAEVGIIEKVSLRNFMCHDKLDVAFGSNVNFLIGRNGSGKSAILTGIVVGLGGKATTTNRGTSIKGFIKNNKSSSTVSVRLRNRGPDAYKSGEYGSSIIVERRINNDSQGGYKLKSSEGKVISTKREELNHILDQFNIQVDNPVAILNQETSRNFLHSKSPHDKYKFFLKATQLEQMKDDYITANEYKDVASGHLQQKEEVLPTLQKEVEEWEQKFKAFDAIEDLRNKIVNLKNQMAWAIVSEREKSLEAPRREYRAEEMRTPKFVKYVEECEGKVNKVLQAHEKIQKDLKKMSKDISDMQPKHIELKANRDDRKKAYKSIENETLILKRDIRSIENDKKQIVDRIKELKNSVQHDYEAQRRAREERIQQHLAQLDELKAKQKTSEHSVEQFRAAVARTKDYLYKLKNDEQDLKRSKEQMRTQINNLESARSNRLKRFGSSMPELVAKINEAHKKKLFHQKPRGPIGFHLTLNDQKWARAVEVCLGGLLHAFCVHDHHDERQLEKIMRQVMPKNARTPMRITSQFVDRIHNVSQLKPKSSYPTVLDMLDLKDLDPAIVNCLIDQRMIEAILLIEKSPEARQVMSKHPPKNTKEAYTFEGDQLYCHPTFRYYSNSLKQSNLLTTNLEENISSMKQQIQKYENDLKGIHQESAKKNMEMKSDMQHERSTQTQINKIREQILRFEFEIQELKTYEEPSAPDVTTLEEEVIRYSDMIEDQQEKLNGLNGKLKEAKGELEAADKAYGEIDKKMRSIAQNADPVQEELAKIDAQIEKSKSDKVHYENKMFEHQKKLEEMKTHLEIKEKAVQDSIAKASQICDRINTRRSAKNIESEITQIQKRITAEEKSRGNREEITKKYYSTYESFKDIKRQVTQIKNFLKKLAETLEIRDRQHWEFRRCFALRTNHCFIRMLDKLLFCGKIKWDHKMEQCQLTTLDDMMTQRHRQYFDFRRMIAMRAKYFFIMMLSNRQYTGKIQFDHTKEILNLSVQPSKVNGPQLAKIDMRSLSGGERSFSTVCFILALWDAMESPFRMLDEFDVFMDMVNRRVSMEMMMKTASGQNRRQFIFLTPLDMSYLKKQSNIRIFELRPPERGQTTLSFADQQDDEDDDAKK